MFCLYDKYNNVLCKEHIENRVEQVEYSYIKTYLKTYIFYIVLYESIIF